MTSKEVGFDNVRQIWFKILVSCVTFSNLITLSESQFAAGEMETIVFIHFFFFVADIY